MHLKKFCLISLCVFIAVAVPACKRKDASRPKKSGWTALHKAASDGRRTTDVEKLLANGAEVNSMDKEGRTPLHHVAFLGHIETAKVLIDHGANVNAMDDEGETPLHLAAEGGWPEIIKLLLDADADVNAKSKEGNTPLDCVNQRLELQMVQVIPHFLERYEACAKVLQDHRAK